VPSPTSTTPLSPGVWGILATPFRGPDRAVDTGSFTRQVQLYRELGAAGVVALGVFGEAVKLDAAEQRAVVETAVAAAGDLPVVIGLPGLATAPVLEQARAAVTAAEDRLAGLMVQINDADPEVAAAHLRAVHEATGAGVVAQDYPLSSGVRISTAGLLDLVHRCDFLVAVKAESPPTPPAIAELVAATDVPVFGGLGGVGLIDELAAGAAGAMTGFSHPEGLLAAVRAHERGGFAAARDAFAPWLPLANFEAQAGVQLALRKEILHRRGVLDEPTIRRPGRTVPASLVPLLDHHLAAIQPLLAAASGT
jgi:4-hydroxy-tetrahydrodipicolinate synthase